MKNLDITKTITTGAVLLTIYLFGGMDRLFLSLITFMAIDYLSGVLTAFILGNLSSKIGWKGIVKKTAFLIVVAVAHIIDGVMGANGFARTLVISFLIANEGISILENCGKIGVPIPQKLIDALDSLKNNQGE